mmetsp:Transcript_59988/g.160744  ORF Transcript_59988/g.160744 Transcript_59988/m.160744 type:complete len:220 (+) Transcript_59988:7-666(+)
MRQTGQPGCAAQCRGPSASASSVPQTRRSHGGSAGLTLRGTCSRTCRSSADAVLAIGWSSTQTASTLRGLAAAATYQQLLKSSGGTSSLASSLTCILRACLAIRFLQRATLPRQKLTARSAAGRCPSAGIRSPSWSAGRTSRPTRPSRALRSRRRTLRRSTSTVASTAAVQPHSSGRCDASSQGSDCWPSTSRPESRSRRVVAHTSTCGTSTFWTGHMK